MNTIVNGKQVKKSTGLLNTKENKLFVQRELLPTFIETSNNFKKDVKLSYYIDKFLGSKKHILKPRTYKRYKMTIEKWLIKDYGQMKISEIRISTLKEFLNKQYDLGKQAKTIELYSTIFGGILQEAVYDGVIDSNPFRNIKKGKKVKSNIQPFSTSEVRVLLQHTDGWFRNYIGFWTITN